MCGYFPYIPHLVFTHAHTHRTLSTKLPCASSLHSVCTPAQCASVISTTARILWFLIPHLLWCKEDFSSHRAVVLCSMIITTKSTKMTNMPLEEASWSLRFSKHNNLQLEICCKIMRVLPLIITHNFHGHVYENRCIGGVFSVV